jgi:5-methylcytosine-specific restriction endonuclease McrA
MWRPWTEPELRFLKEAPSHGLRIEDVARTLGRSRGSAAGKASALGIKFPRLGRPGDWSDGDIEVLAAAPGKGLTMIDVAGQLGRTHTAVRSKAIELGVRFPRRPWSPDEDDLLRESAESVPYREIAECLNRTVDAVYSRASYLGLNGRKFLYGPDHHNYRRGTHVSYRGEDWPEVRVKALERDSYSCQDCGMFIPSGNGLVVHHIIPWRLRPVNELRWLVTLCPPDHLRRPEHWWREIPESVARML